MVALSESTQLCGRLDSKRPLSAYRADSPVRLLYRAKLPPTSTNREYAHYDPDERHVLHLGVPIHLQPKNATHNRIRGRFRRESRCEFTDKSHNNQPWFCLAEYFEGQLVNTCRAWIVLCRCNVPSM